MVLVPIELLLQLDEAVVAVGEGGLGGGGRRWEGVGGDALEEEDGVAGGGSGECEN